MSDMSFNFPSPIISFLPPKHVRPKLTFPLHPNRNFTRVLAAVGLLCIRNRRRRQTQQVRNPGPLDKGTFTPDVLICDFSLVGTRSLEIDLVIFLQSPSVRRCTLPRIRRAR